MRIENEFGDLWLVKQCLRKRTRNSWDGWGQRCLPTHLLMESAMQGSSDDPWGPKQKKFSKKKNHLPNDQFLIKNLLKNYVFGSSERLPPLSAVPPQIKRRTPQLVNPTQPRRVFSHHAFLMCKCFVFLQQLHQNCIARCFLINLPACFWSIC